MRLMEATRNAGIIQSSPKRPVWLLYALPAVRHPCLRAAVYAGLHFWQLGESHYWGHNAIIRVKPFIEHCALAPLPVRVASFYSVARLRRSGADASCGWASGLSTTCRDRTEELPPNLLDDELKRDRRWCHGNLMNFRLFLGERMHLVHTAVFLTGVMSHLRCTAVVHVPGAVHGIAGRPCADGAAILPATASFVPGVATVASGHDSAVASTMVLLFLPKLPSIILIWCKVLKEYGGFFR